MGKVTFIDFNELEDGGMYASKTADGFVDTIIIDWGDSIKPASSVKITFSTGESFDFYPTNDIDTYRIKAPVMSPSGRIIDYQPILNIGKIIVEVNTGKKDSNFGGVQIYVRPI